MNQTAGNTGETYQLEKGLEKAEEITLERCRNVNGAVRLYRAILALMTPLF